MNIKCIIALPVILFLGSCLYAQEGNPPQWGKIPQEHLALTECPFDKDADAVILEEYGYYEVETEVSGYVVYNFRHVRIKILKEGGIEMVSNQEIDYYSEKNYEDVIGIRAQTLNMEDGKLVPYKIKARDIFEEKGEYWSTKKIAFPKVQIGSILEFSYKYKSKRFFAPPPWFFQHDIPSLKSTIVPYTQDNLSYIYLFQGEKATQPDVAKRNYYQLTDIPALKDEPFITILDDYRERTQAQLMKYVTRDGIKTWNSTWKEFTLDTHKERYLKYVKSKPEIKAITEGLVKTEPDPEMKIKNIYKYIVDNFHYNKKRRKYPKQSIKDLWRSRQGSSAELNLLMVNMLREAGIDAFPLLISTRDHGSTQTLVPLIDQFNQLLCCALVDGKPTISNATSTSRPYYLPAIEDLNEKGWLMDTKDPRWIRFPNTYTSKGVAMARLDLAADGEISGTLDHAFNDYLAYRMRGYFGDGGEKRLREEVYEELLKEGEVENVEIKNEDDPYESIKLSSTIKTRENVMQAGDLMYINPMLIFTANENPFNSPERHYPVDFAYKIQNEFVLSLKLPEGYEVESLPENARIGLEDRSMTYLYFCESDFGTIQLRSQLKINKPKFDYRDYGAIRQLYDLMIARQGEQIVLKKIK